MKRLRPRARYTPLDEDGTVGVQVTFWRQSRKMGQAELAKVLGIRERKLRRIEASTDPVPAYVHWALKGLDTQTSPLRHIVVRANGLVELMGVKDVLLLNADEQLYLADLHIKVWVESK